MHVIADVEKAEEVKQDYVETLINKAQDFTIEERAQAFPYREPHFEYHGACAGCGETAYITQLCRMFGDRMIIANATGCTSIYGFSFPFNPYSVNSRGQGPAWANSLFEDNAEFGFGMVVAIAQRRDRIIDNLKLVMADEKCPSELKEAGQAWIESAADIDKSHTCGAALTAALAKVDCECEKILFLKRKDNQEIFGKPVIII